MATTIPFPFGQHYVPEDHSEERQTIVAQIIEWYESSLGDADKAADGYDAGVYTGAFEAYFDVLVLLTGVDQSLVKAYHDGESLEPKERTLHIGVDVEVLGAVLKHGVRHGYGWVIDGDGWECWGEAPGDDVNDATTLHLTLSTPVTDLQATVIVGQVAQWLTLLANQSNPIDNGTLATLTDVSDWAEDAGLIKQHPTDDDQVVLTERKTLTAGRYELPPL